MNWHSAVSLLLLALMTGCASSGRVVRLETGRGKPVVFTPRTDEVEPVELGRAEFQEAVSRVARGMRASTNPQGASRQLFGVDARSGSYLVNPRTQRVTPLEDSSLVPDAPAAEVELTRAYLRWCERTGRPGDCLRLLVESPTINGDGRYALAMALAQGVVLEELLEAFKDMADPQAVVSAVLWTGTMYLVLWTVPEPTSKGLAAVMTATLIVYLGVDTFWSLIEGFKQLVERADRATTFHELREAGERYGKVMGRNAARAFALLATVAIGNTAQGFSSSVPTLPGSALVASQAEAHAGIRLSAVGEVRAVAVTGEVVTVELAPGALAMTARATGSVAATSVELEGHDHHIATNKWWIAIHNGGPWSPEFQKIFDKAGMSLDDPANIVRVKGHKGPHSQEYHEKVFQRLFRATSRCRTMAQCREALTAELRRLARDISTEATELNMLVTRTE